MSSVASAAPLEVDSIVQLTNGSGYSYSKKPVWSPDGTEIAYTKDFNLHKMSLADQTDIELATRHARHLYSWSPDGNQILFMKTNHSASSIYYDLWIVNEDGSSQRQISPNNPINHFAWSPDGSQIAYTNRTALALMEPDGSNSQIILSQEGLGSLAWSPDSSKLVFGKYVNENIGQLKVINSDGTNLMDIVSSEERNTDVYPQTQSWQSQIWSPDGSKIVYYSYYGFFDVGTDTSYGDSSVHTVNSDGTNQNKVGGDGVTDASFSPDGSKIVYSYADHSFSIPKNPNIWVMDADGSNKTQLTTGSTYSGRPVWSPDGRKIAFDSGGDIYIINLKEAFVSDGVITVDDDGGADFTTIQAAVDAANDGDTIRVSPGTYNENVEVDKSVIIKSTDGAEVTNVVGASDNEYVFEVTADETSINGFSISFGPGSDDYYPGKTAIRIFSSSGSRVSNNTIEDCLLGISINKSENIILDGNLLQHNIQGIELTSSIDNDLTGNMISNREYHTAGIVLYYSDHNTLDSNGGSRADIYMYHSNSNVLTNNDAFSYDVLPGIYLSYSNENKIINNNAGGININGEDNILLKDIVYGTMDGHPPIQITGTNNTLINNTAYCTLYSDAGISVSGSNHYLEDNIVADALGTDLYDLNTNPGIILYSTSYSTLTGNIVSKKYGSAISLSSANENLIYNNFFNTSA
ncbi:NosD domain-containing protein, partial [Methanolobus sp.]|uniref:NosD domain-containing protein n=1 Tax=Methanolobus sp. TaxID=1874737 RepID=UPI0025D7F9EC